MLAELIRSYRKSAAIYALVKTGLSVHLKDGIYVGISELSHKCGIDNSRLSRLCDFLIEIGVLVNNNHGVTLSDECKALADPNSLESLLVKHEVSSYNWNSWLMYPESLLQNDHKSAFEIAHGQPFFEYISNHESLKSNFDSLMSRNSDKLAKKLLEAYDFNKHNRILDLGGGEGNLLIKINEKVKGKHYAVLDRYNEIPVSENMEFINGDFLKSVPSGYDLYILKNVIHNWSDNDSISILKNCRKAMDNDATILLITIMKKPLSPIVNIAKSMDIFMDVLLLGKERYLTEFDYLADQAGLIIQDTQDLDESFSFIKLGVK
ncbi:Multifunctional cyclase-dehydratase-3-O-methyl transferase TcmN [Photorhabdus australis subsp. thailandensis]|uniref:Multifunctional cyclase-dehydratase-3-O-methyl transferase TcmN n=1 Tax=Photorhabdus australis subsp. thailandensis TaxID=2805096 RepID=A0A1C0U9B3_9GAMM|nr:methyltransferase [Photorhabdus australis]OCQ54466.1 Multifunctional cyclase-dehydratase-3-O-methyl transferase TcmN [Photorhabdus australis subsp. thailandensis]